MYNSSDHRIQQVTNGNYHKNRITTNNPTTRFVDTTTSTIPNHQQQQQQQQHQSRIPTRIPLPIGIELYNLFYSKDDDIVVSTTTTKCGTDSTVDPSSSQVRRKKWRYRREYKSELLYKVQLEISVIDYYCDNTTTTMNDYSHCTTKSGKKRRLLYKEICQLPPTINPSWRHLNEKTSTTTPVQQQQQQVRPTISYDTLTIDEYDSMMARISILLQDDSSRTTGSSNDPNNNNNNNNSDPANSSKNTTTTITTTTNELGKKSNRVVKQQQNFNSSQRIRTDSYEFYNLSSDYWDTSHNYDDPTVLFQEPPVVIPQLQQQQQQQDPTKHDDSMNDPNADMSETTVSSSLSLPRNQIDDDDTDKITQQNQPTRTQIATTNSVATPPATTAVVIDVPIHPSKLIKIGKIPANLPLNCIVVHFSDGTIRVQPIHYQLLYDSKQYGVVVNPTLPLPNTTTTAGNGGSSSVRKAKLSLSQQSSFDGTGNIASGAVSGDDASTNTTVINFDDDAFAALDAVAPPPKILHTTPNDLFPDVLSNDPKTFNNHNNNNKQTKGSNIQNVTTNGRNEEQVNINLPLLNGQHDTSYINSDHGDESNSNSFISDDDDDFVVDETVTEKVCHEISLDDQYDETLQQLIKEDDEFELLLEQQRLQEILQQEEIELEKEMKQLQIGQSTIHDLVSEIQIIEQRTIIQIPEEIIKEQVVQKQYEFLVESQRIRLVLELSIIYNITVISADRRYLIRGIEIPRMEPGFSSSSNLSSSTTTSTTAFTVSDDEVSAALGYLCHVVDKLSVYLNVHLRYKLICFSSRSAIIDMNIPLSISSSSQGTSTTSASTATNNNITYTPWDYYNVGQYYPLFYGRGVEREQFEYAVYLLHCNVDCLCRSRNIRIASNAHILAKIKRIYENVIEGY